MKKVVLASAAIGFGIWLVVRDRRNPSSALSWSKRQRMLGTLDQVRGTINQVAGRLTGSPSLTAKGILAQAIGEIRRGVGKTVDSAKDAIQA